MIVYDDIRKECERFYTVFSFMPEYIGLHSRQVVKSIPPYSLLDVQVGQAQFFIELRPFNGVKWDDFILYNSKVSIVKPKELEGLPMIIKLVESYGYRVILLEPPVSHHNETLYIFDHERYYLWTFLRSLVGKPLEEVKYEVKKSVEKIEKIRGEHV